jgi:hypothetical protein
MGAGDKELSVPEREGSQPKQARCTKAPLQIEVGVPPCDESYLWKHKPGESKK